MSSIQIPISEQLETAQRLRTLLGLAARSLRPTHTGAAQELTPTRASVLLAADRHGPIRLSRIAEREGLNPTLLSRTLAHLVDAGLVSRTPDADDRRSVWVSATAQGHAIAEGVRRDRAERLAAALAALGEEQRRTVESALPALEQLVELLRDPARGDLSDDDSGYGDAPQTPDQDRPRHGGPSASGAASTPSVPARGSA